MKISIITVCFNDLEGLKRTLTSIDRLECTDYELIIQDGGSTDGSVKYAEEWKSEHEDFLKENGIRVNLESTRDGGVFYGMNKAVEYAEGDYCIFMNSGDSFYDKFVLNNFLAVNPTADIYTGIAASHKNNKVEPWYPFAKNAVNLLSFWENGSLSHQSSFIKTSLMKKNLYDTKFRIGADTKFFMKTLLLDHVSYQPLYFMVSNFMSDGMSSDPQKATEERNAIMVDLFGKEVFQEIKKLTKSDWNHVIKQVDGNSKLGKLVAKVVLLMLTVRKSFLKIKR